jgi:hypothetical protein
MSEPLRLFASLIITFSGIVAPFVLALLSVFHEGISILTGKYESEMSLTKKNLEEQLKSKTLDKTNLDDIQKSINKLRASEKEAGKKLNSLNPKIQALRIYIPLIVAFVCLISTNLMADSPIYFWALFGVALASFILAAFFIWMLFSVVIDAKKSVEDRKREAEESNDKARDKTNELLSALVKKESKYFLEKVYLAVDSCKIDSDDKIISLVANDRKILKIGITNSEARMAKNVEVGIILTSDFIIEKTDYRSLTTTEKEQIVRYEINSYPPQKRRDKDPNLYKGGKY